MAAFTLSAVNPASLSASEYVAGYMAYDGGPGRIYTSAATIANAASASSSGSPSIASITQVTAVDGAFPDPESSAGTAIGGPYVMKLTPATADTVNASSPMSRIYLSPNALVVTISA